MIYNEGNDNLYAHLAQAELKPFPETAFLNLLKFATSLDAAVFPQVFECKGKSGLMSALSDLYTDHGRTAIPLKERLAAIAVNDKDEALLSRVISRGSSSEVSLGANIHLAQQPLPLGWKTIGMAHNHPVDDVPSYLISRIMGVPSSASKGDLYSFLSTLKSVKVSCEVVVSTLNISLFVATQETLRKLKTTPVSHLNLSESARGMAVAENRQEFASLLDQWGLIFYSSGRWSKNSAVFKQWK